MAYDTNGATRIGTVTIGRTVYQVFELGVGDASRAAGIVGNYAFVGPNGAQYFVTDHGPKYRLNSVAVGGARPWTPAPRPLRGLERRHLDELRASIAIDDDDQAFEDNRKGAADLHELHDDESEGV